MPIPSYLIVSYGIEQKTIQNMELINKHLGGRSTHQADLCVWIKFQSKKKTKTITARATAKCHIHIMQQTCLLPGKMR